MAAKTPGWTPITDIEADEWTRLADPGLRSLASVWQDERDRLSEGGGLEEFVTRLQRRWAIETGILERLYDVDRGVTKLLIERGINADLLTHTGNGGHPHRAARFISDQLAVVEAIMDSVGRSRCLTTGYVKELHAALTRSQETTEALDQFGRVFDVALAQGEYKSRPNNPTRPDGTVHFYCPPQQVASEMDRLIDLHDRHANEVVAPEVEAAWLHHRFVQIHPFQDGNGRVARTLTSIVLLQAGWFPLVIDRDQREEYLDALETADAGDLNNLVTLFAQIERAAFVQALSVSESVLTTSALQDLLAATKAMAERRVEEVRSEQRQVLELASMLHQNADGSIKAVAQRYQQELGPVIAGSKFWVRASAFQNEAKSHWFRAEIIDIAQRLGYFASFRSGTGWINFVIDSESRSEIVVSLHSLGRQFTGVMAASAFWHRREREDHGFGPPSGPWELAEPFEFTYLDEAAEVVPRFERWLEDALLEALRQWQDAL